jgi:Fe-S cluster assembly protein SufD
VNAEVAPIKTAAETALAREFAHARTRLPGGKAVAAQREAAFDVFAKEGLPHRRVEEWKYTDLRALMRDAKPLASPPDAAAKARAKFAGAILGDVEARRLVFVDGAFVAELSDLKALESGLTVGSLAAALATEDATVKSHLGKLAPVSDVAVALNTALMGDGAVIRISAAATIERPLHLLFVASEKPAATFIRSLVVVEEGARAMLIESHEGPQGADYQTNAVVELFVGDNAHVDHVKIIGEGADALHVSTLAAAIGAHARFNSFTFTAGGAVVRNQLFLNFDGEGTIAGIRGATLIKDRQHADTTLVANHVARDCQSREMFKSVLDGEAHGVFQGRIIVRPHAQKTDARMMTQALLLSERAEADNKPELEIFADDVQCGHGATAGSLDDELKFYLMARGIPAAEAETLLIQAFLGEAIEGIEHAGLREALMESVAAWLKARE